VRYVVNISPGITLSNQLTSLAPILKWPGGKRWLLDHLLKYGPRSFENYHEPFLGGAALFFKLQPQNAFLSDINHRLIETYRALKDEPRKVIAALRRLRNTKSEYYRVRDRYLPRSSAGLAAKVYYLQRLSFNGIYRENRFGQFNVPYGYKDHLAVYDRLHILAASKALAGANLVTGDFAGVLDRAKSGDFVYMDPPYTVAHNNNGFIKYNARMYSWQSQQELSAVAQELRSRGCFVMISNAYHSPLINLYTRGFRVVRISRNSVIAAQSEHRRRRSEALIISV